MLPSFPPHSQAGVGAAELCEHFGHLRLLHALLALEAGLHGVTGGADAGVPNGVLVSQAQCMGSAESACSGLIVMWLWPNAYLGASIHTEHLQVPTFTSLQGAMSYARRETYHWHQNEAGLYQDVIV
jgi:hypothetical protein